MRILAAPHVHVREPLGEPGLAQEPGGFAANLLRGYWERDPQQRRLLPRLRCAGQGRAAPAPAPARRAGASRATGLQRATPAPALTAARRRPGRAGPTCA
jgi:hypothetical protein